MLHEAFHGKSRKHGIFGSFLEIQTRTYPHTTRPRIVIDNFVRWLRSLHASTTLTTKFRGMYGLAVLVPALLGFLPACGDGTESAAGAISRQRPAKIVAHRGVNKFSPENTIPSIEMAIAMGLDYVEIDVRTTADDRTVLMHDDTVDDTTDGSGLVRDLTAEEIKQLDAGSWFSPEFAGTEVPFLEEALAVMQGRIGAYVDVKDARPKALVEAFEDHGMLSSSVIYDDPLMQWIIKGINADATIMPEVGDSELLFNLVRNLLDPAVVAVSWGEPEKTFIEQIHSHGIEVFMDIMGETDNPEGMRWALDLGVDAIQTDHPDILLEVMKEKASPVKGANRRGSP